MEATTYQEVQGLSRMTVGELRDKYLEVFEEETRSYHKEFLRKRIAWRIQALAEGDLSERARRRAEELANDADLRTRSPRDPVASGSAEVKARTATSRISPSHDPRLPLPGTLLAREFQGRDIVVKVLDNGFVFNGRRYKSLSAIAQEVTDNHGRVWKVVSDGSLINVPVHLRAEVVSPVLSYEDIPILQEVVRALRACGAKVDDRCGIHVHVDATAFDGRTLGNLAKIVYKQEALILTALGVNETRRRNYSKPVSDDLIAQIERRRPRTRDQLNHIWYGYHNRQPQHYDSTRYHGVNLHNVWYRGTVEFRWFEGTLHAGKVKAYIQLVLAVAAKALNGRAASSRKRSFDPQSARYDFRVFLLHLGHSDLGLAISDCGL